MNETKKPKRCRYCRTTVGVGYVWGVGNVCDSDECDKACDEEAEGRAQAEHEDEMQRREDWDRGYR